MRLLSRNAEALFWLARYLERAANLARVVEMQSSFGRPTQEPDGNWSWLLTLHSDEERFKERHETTTARDIVNFYVNDRENPGSIRTVIHWARENSRTLRSFSPTEMWVQINSFNTQIQNLSVRDIEAAELPRTCAIIRAGCHAQIGIAESTLYRDEGYAFFQLGLLIERADQTSRLLDVKFAQRAIGIEATDPAEDFVFWSSILRTAAAYQVFRRLEPGGATAERVARLLILNSSHPRSIGYCAREIGKWLQELAVEFHVPHTEASIAQCLKLQQGLQTMGRDPKLVSKLHDMNDWVQRSLIDLTATISATYFERQRAAVPSPASTSSTQSQSQS